MQPIRFFHRCHNELSVNYALRGVRRWGVYRHKFVQGTGRESGDVAKDSYAIAEAPDQPFRLLCREKLASICTWSSVKKKHLLELKMQ